MDTGQPGTLAEAGHCSSLHQPHVLCLAWAGSRAVYWVSQELWLLQVTREPSWKVVGVVRYWTGIPGVHGGLRDPGRPGSQRSKGRRADLEQRHGGQVQKRLGSSPLPLCVHSAPSSRTYSASLNHILPNPLHTLLPEIATSPPHAGSRSFSSCTDMGLLHNTRGPRDGAQANLLWVRARGFPERGDTGVWSQRMGSVLNQRS